jgi:hypothetical protein
MLRTSELNMADSVSPNDVNVFLDNAAWAIRSTYHTVLKASPGAAIFGRDMLFGIPFVANWYKIGEHRQSLTDRDNACKNKRRLRPVIKYSLLKMVYSANLSPILVRTMDYNDSSYKWNYQGSMRNKIGKNKHPESNTLYRGYNPIISRNIT